MHSHQQYRPTRGGWPATRLTCDQLVTYYSGVDEVFRALADPTRRSLLDELFRADGQTLGALVQRFSMTRFGVMKHLKQLEDAGLVVTRRRGREKLHYLNPVPIRLVHDRWVSKYAEPWAAALSGLKQELEKPVEKIFEIYIRTTPERLWQAITDPVIRSKYNDSCRLTLTHDQLRDGANDEIYGGWPMILSGLKTWLETGELLTTPGSLMYR